MDTTSPPDPLNPHWFLIPLTILPEVAGPIAGWGTFILVFGALVGMVVSVRFKTQLPGRPAWLRLPSQEEEFEERYDDAEDSVSD